ncbi:MAG: hypothetical protein ACK4MS_08970 [Paracoccaceae bacterium]
MPRRTGESLGPFVAIGLPQVLAAALAADRPILLLEPDMISTAGLSALENAIVGCRLLGAQVDAIDVIARLVAAEYRGPLIVVTPPLPNPRMVERELALVADGMKVRLIEMS